MEQSALVLGCRMMPVASTAPGNTFSKLILCAVMLRRRHRGLLVAIDRAVLLPSDKLMMLKRRMRR